MTKPTPKPTVASLQRELAQVRREYEVAKRNWLESGITAGRRREELEQVRADLAPVLAYLQSGWLGLVQGNYRRLKAFTEGGNG